MSLNFGIAIFPLSWHLGFWIREKKSIFSLGPIRLVHYKRPGGWKPGKPKRFEKRFSTWIIRLFGGEYTYPVTIEINWAHFGTKVFHGPFYPDRAAARSFPMEWGWQKGGPLIWGTSGLLDLHVDEPSTGTRIWFYSIWGTICHIDVFIDRRDKKHASATYAA